jgi:hypothetical protein
MASLVMLLLSDARRLQTAATLSSNAGPANAARQNVFVLDNYGARGDEKHDDTQALTRAWSAACSSSRPAVLLIPKGKSYLVKAITLSGPCKSSVVLICEWRARRSSENVGMERERQKSLDHDPRRRRSHSHRWRHDQWQRRHVVEELVQNRQGSAMHGGPDGFDVSQVQQSECGKPETC